ncbi:MAG: tRNA pseudouridine(38-40) synthase TruA [Acidobacteria bacterium]|nr:tRNA pseudouridine(38-40) synthase TruA [Acidobacteriota bacterium]
MRAGTQMQRYKVTLQYDGTRYQGWQSQKSGRTIQDALATAAQEVLRAQVSVGGAGRTDAGVHALAQVAHLELRPSGARSAEPAGRFFQDPGHPPDGATLTPPGGRLSGVNLQSLRDRLNAALPHDIAVLKVENAPTHFHARHDAVHRYYLYQVACRKTAFSKRFVWWVKEPLALSRVKKAAELLSGRHDFAAFADRRGEKKSTLVEVSDCSLRPTGDLLLIRIGASHFLWKMVRRLVGAMVEVGLGRLRLENFEEMLRRQSGSAAPWTAPASGLFLEKIAYSATERPGELQPVLWA